MAFTQVEKGARGLQFSSHEVRMGSRFANGPGTSRAVYISISGDVVKKVGWTLQDANETRVTRVTNASSTTRVTIKLGILEGSGEDAGFMVLKEDTSRNGYVAGADKGIYDVPTLSMAVAISNLRHYVLNDTNKETEPEPVEFSIDTNSRSLLIQVPDWLRYNPQSVPEPVPVVQTVVEMHHKKRRHAR